MVHTRPLFPLFTVFSSKQTVQFLQQINVKKCTSCIWGWDSNPRPLEHESSPITTRPGQQPETHLWRCYLSQCYFRWFLSWRFLPAFKSSSSSVVGNYLSELSNTINFNWLSHVANLINILQSKLRLLSRTWLDITPYYDSRVVNYDRGGFIRLAIVLCIVTLAATATWINSCLLSETMAYL